MARSRSITRYYLQCDRQQQPQAWPDDRIWDELRLRMRANAYGPLPEGPIVDRGVVDMCSLVIDPMQHGRLYLAGDAASLISPSAAKGANPAIMEAEVLALGLIAAATDGDEGALARYSIDCLPRIWRAQAFSHWMINLLHPPLGDSHEAAFLRALQHAQPNSLGSSRACQDYFAENYVGI